MKSPECHIKICQPKNWAKFFPYSLYRAGWKSSILGWFFPIGITCDFEKCQFGLVRPTFILANFNMCLLTPQRNALLWFRLVLGWVKWNLNFGSLDRRLPSALSSSFTKTSRSMITQLLDHLSEIWLYSEKRVFLWFLQHMNGSLQVVD